MHPMAEWNKIYSADISMNIRGIVLIEKKGSK